MTGNNEDLDAFWDSAESLCHEMRENVPTGRYVVSVKGTFDSGSGEIAVVDEGNDHGLRSYGEFDNRNKILIASSGGPCADEFLPIIWEAHVALARKIADDLNTGKLVLPDEGATP